MTTTSSETETSIEESDEASTGQAKTESSGWLTANFAAGEENGVGKNVGLPRHISGGFRGVAEDLDRRGRDWAMMVRLLEQQRLHLETAEAERVRLYQSLEAILPAVRASGQVLEETIENTKSGDVSANLSALFVENLRTLDELENVSKALTANLLWTRSSWEQYARSVIGAQKMREELKL